jgi:hypothetical protein
MKSGLQASPGVITVERANVDEPPKQFIDARSTFDGIQTIAGVYRC